MIGKTLIAQRDGGAARSARRFDFRSRRLLAPVLAIVLLAGSSHLARGETAALSKGLTPSLRAADVFTLKDRLGAADPVSDSLQLAQNLALGDSQFPKDAVVAFEENRFFIYAVGAAAKAGKTPEGSLEGEAWPRLVRRLIFLKPATFVIDDQLRSDAPDGPVRWLFHSNGEARVAGSQFQVAEPQGEIVCGVLLPRNVSVRSSRPTGDARPGEHVVEVVPEASSSEVRFVHVLQVRAAAAGEGSPARSELVEREGQVQLTVWASDRTFRLTLPPPRSAAGEIEIASASQETLLARRPLPSGVLPHGPEGTQLLERWDAAYRGGRQPGWDTGRPSSTLRQAVEEGAVRPCRVVELGCGSGTNAIWLAQRGFDVTAIDIAPTALSRANQKAQEAGVSVRCVLADVLAPPELPRKEPFDFVFDRGCYHGVRRQSAAGYVESLRRLTRPGALVLILAGNANDPRKGGGPPRVKEEEIRGDFSADFQFEWLRETRFDSRSGDQEGALAWSILLRRKAGP